MTKTTIAHAATLVAAALAVEPALTLDGLDADSPSLTEPASLRAVGAAAAFLALCRPAKEPLARSHTKILSGEATDRAGFDVPPGAILAAAIALGVDWEMVVGTPFARLAVRPPPRWDRPTVGLVVQVARRFNGPIERRLVEGLVGVACTRDGYAPPAGQVSRAVDEALACRALTWQRKRLLVA